METAALWRSYLTSSLGKRALMIFSIGKVVYMYSLASFLDRDSVHCGGRPILAPPPLGELAATESGVATSAMARLCDVPLGAGSERLWARVERPVGVFEAGTMGHLSRLESRKTQKRDRSCIVWGMGAEAVVQHSTLAATRRPEEMHCSPPKGRRMFIVQGEGEALPGLVWPWCERVALAMHVGSVGEGGCAGGRGWEGVGAELLIRD